MEIEQDRSDGGSDRSLEETYDVKEHKFD